jgi:hypothetical protein
MMVRQVNDVEGPEKTSFRIGIEGWLLVASILLLICALVTPAWNALTWTASSIIWLVDVRNWTQLGWFIATVVVVVVLLGIRWWSARKR